MKRFLFNILLLCSVFYAPWWLAVLVAFGGAFFCSLFYEVIAFGLLFDLLYGAQSLAIGGIAGTVTAVAIYLIAGYVKKIVR